MANDSQSSGQFDLVYTANTGKEVPLGAVDAKRSEYMLPERELAARFTEQRVELSVAVVPSSPIPASTKLPDSVS